ncbi:GFA family protein [Croceicoccus ponticola]|uniref:GFA family protein n=1 Tax=Croceicoccus ponticola TaxID=2217664 RepID=A0A437GY36_9SPHN|nr:GFA family protein [Croceicoccus ponticola]RVQ66376.1 GFA family protein [Croceicoccus ponticola]
MNNSNVRREGGCLCGSVRYSVPFEPLATVVCHCRNCQKQAGSALSVVAVFPRDELALDGVLTVYEDKGTSGQRVFRRFCGTCGSPVLTDTERAREQGVIFVKAGTFDDISTLRPTTHYWVKRAHPWLTLPDNADLLEQE